MLKMDVNSKDIFNWQRLPGLSDSEASPPSTFGLHSGGILLEKTPLDCNNQIIPSIEDATDDTADDLQTVQEFNCKVGKSVANSRQDFLRWPESEEHQFDDQDIAPDTQATDTTTKKPIVVDIPRSTLRQPKSLFTGFIPPATETREGDAIATLLKLIKPQHSSDEDFFEFDLDQFSVYWSAYLYPNELRSLQQLATRQSSGRFYFDGVLSYGTTRFFLKRIPFQQLPIGNYGVKEHTVGDQIWIRSEMNEIREREIYYKLKSPSFEYIRFYEPFSWIADLAKHIFDYFDYLKENGRRAVLLDLKSRFSVWLLQNHQESAVFKRWYSANRGSDFRGAFIANVDFIWKESYGLNPKSILWHVIWGEVKTLTEYKPNLGISPNEELPAFDVKKSWRSTQLDQVTPTIVTAYVYDLFSHLIFGNILEPRILSTAVKKKQAIFVLASQPNAQHSVRTSKRDQRDRDTFINAIKVGDVVSTKPDDDSSGTEWKQHKSKHYDGEHLWFGLIQKVHELPKGKRSFDVIWLYQSIDTPCGIMKYPWKNELFLSNNCTCHNDTAKLRGAEILSTHSVEWFGNPSTSAEFFVRQTYLSDDCRWTTLRKEHLTCSMEVLEKEGSYNVGDTVLVETNHNALQLEPFIVESFFEEGEKTYTRVRRLSRRRSVDRNASSSPPNELVYTNQLVEIASRRIFRHCLVRAFQSGETIPTPYDYDGAGNLFFITHQETETGTGELIYTPLDTSLLHQLRQGFNPFERQPQKLQGLDLFCGAGNLGRGLEDAGAVEMRWANDIWSHAIHTYMANSKPGTCTPFLGSVDDLLLRAMQGNNSKVPQPGDVQIISAGSPCPGFSLLTSDRTTNDQRKNQSLIASFASYIDLYRPYYGVLENVPTMVNSKTFRHACVFSQLVCALVGLGYQVQVMFLDAWSFGAPQTRSRIFLCFSAPGFRMPKVPAPSHSHPPGTMLTKLGEMSCGRPFDSRKLVPTPFKYVSIREAIKDLPDIQDAKPDYSVGFPDHRLSIGITPTVRNQLFFIPTQPWGMSFSKAYFGRPGLEPVLSELDRMSFPGKREKERVTKSSKGWGRVDPNRLMSTISTKCGPTDSRVGTTNHWYQHRPLTVLEIRRVQGFRKHEVLIGKPVHQWRLVGNSVARQVSLALGLSIREAWFGTLFDEPHSPQLGLGASAKDKLAECGNNGTVSPNHTIVTENPRDRSDYYDIGKSFAAAAAEAAAAVENDVESGSDTAPPSEEYPALIPTPLGKSQSLTPATSESNHISDFENFRKRPLATFAGEGEEEAVAKRPRVDVGQGHELSLPGVLDNGVEINKAGPAYMPSPLAWEMKVSSDEELG